MIIRTNLNIMQDIIDRLTVKQFLNKNIYMYF